MKNKIEAIAENLISTSAAIVVRNCKQPFNVQYFSAGFSLLSGYSQYDFNTLFNGDFSLIINKQDLLKVNAAAKQAALTGLFLTEYRINCKNGKTIWVLDKGSYQDIGDGQQLLFSILTDITDYKNKEDALRFSEKRYEIAMMISGIAMFEYDIVTGDLIFYDNIAKMYNMPTIVPNGVETFVQKVIVPESAAAYREMYRQIHAGVPQANCSIQTRDADGTIHDFELTLTTVFDNDGKPMRAIGVRKNISQMLMLQREKEFGKNLVSDKTYIFEADITNNKVTYVHPDWEITLNLTKKLSYTATLQSILDNLIAPEFVVHYGNMLSSTYIKRRFELGETIIRFDYRSKSGSQYIWHEAIVNIIKDVNDGTLSIRFYRMDINKLKLKQLKASNERKLYESMMSKAVRAYEVNVTKNVAVRGQEDWHSLFSIQQTKIYNEMIIEFSQKACHPQDSKAFYESFNRNAVIKKFSNGEQHIKCEYRSLSDGVYKWYCCKMHLFEDPDNLDILGFSYVEDINDTKQKETLLKFKADHDQMTGIYNKTITEKLIKSVLKQQPKQLHAFLMIDIDNFKYINDNFGHKFGDYVIKNVVEKIKVALSGSEIFGRVGGDEFVVFMGNICSQDQAELLAERLVTMLKQTYTNDNHSLIISTSVGIAFFPNDATTFADLYERADEALYSSKSSGKNKYSIFKSSAK